MSHLYKEPRICKCGYSTTNRSNWCTHTKRCREHVGTNPVEAELRERVAADGKRIQSLEAQVAADREQLAAKDRQIEELIRCAKKPRTENHYTTNNNQINVFGKESLEHITSAKLQELLTDPDTSVARLVTLKQTVDANRNVRVPNAREKWVQVYREGEDGQRYWETVPKGDVIGDLVMDNALFLEGEADESTVPGVRYSQWRERLLESQDQNGRMYKDQMDRCHKAIVDSTRSSALTKTLVDKCR